MTASDVIIAFVAPKITVSGRSLDNLSFEVKGSPALIEEVKRRLK